MSAALVLASASPRRAQLLRAIGLEFDIVPADVDESRHPDEDPLDYVARVAATKAMAVGRRVARSGGSPVVLAADTTVALDGRVLGKPRDDDDARRTLALLSGRTHQVHTAVVAWRPSGRESVTVTTDVAFVPLGEVEIDWYLSIGEHADKAGSYGLQGAGGALVRRVDGSVSNVVGLPLAETIELLGRVGIGPASAPTTRAASP